ncbi:MAG: oligosaccharide flippase family protein [Myxococcales bacterium]|nr:oligosaccharide flippase family protein [Myxococcales bacterium]
MSLAKKAALGFLWTTLANVGGRLVTILSTFIVARFVLPYHQGEFNNAFVLVFTIANATQLGVGQYIAAHPQLGRAVAFHGSVLTMTAGAVGGCAALALMHPVASWLHSPDMTAYVPGLVVGHLVDRLGWLPRYVLVRDMEFRKIGVRAFLGETVFAVMSVVLATRGFDAFALVYANIARAVVGLVYLASVTHWRDYLQPCKLTRATFGAMLRFGWPVSLSMVLHYGATTWDNWFMTFRFGSATTGVYNQAYKLAELPGTYLGEQINDVLVPTFARLSDAEARRRGFVRAASLMALVVFPVALGLGAVSYTAVEALYPPTYAGVAPLLAVLASLSMMRSLGVLSAGLLQVVGRTRMLPLVDGVLVVVLLGSMAALSPLGPTWAAAGVGIAFLVNTLHYLRVLRPEGIRILPVLRALAGPLAACLLMGVAVLAARNALHATGLHAAVRLVIEILVGAAAYVAAALVFARKAAKDFLDIGLGALKRRRAAAG